MKDSYTFSVLIIVLTLIATSASTQQGQPLAKIHVHQNGHVQVLDSYDTGSQAIGSDLINNQPLTPMNPGPNLTSVGQPRDYTFTYPDLTIEVRVANDGTSAAGSSRLGYYLSADCSASTSDNLIGDDYVSALPAGLNSYETITVDVSAYPGTWWVCFILDYKEEVAEDNENDNRYIITGTITVPQPPKPDLIVTSVHVIDHEGPDISYKLTVKNDGGGATDSNFKNIIYLSRDKTITDEDLRINDWNVTKDLVPGDSKTSWDLTSNISDIPAGEYYLGAIADGNNDIAELDEGNNTKCADSPKVIIPEGHEEPEECEGNMITNWNFADGMDDWQFFIGGPADASCSIENGVFHAQITIGGDYPHEVTLHQYEFTILNGNTYTVTFDARAANPRNLIAWVARTTPPYTLYNSDYIFPLTTDWQTITYTFTMSYDTDPAARIGFDFGTSDVDVYLDNICLVDITSTDVQKEEHSYIARTFDLFQNYPNPFNPSTTIRFQVPEDCFVSLKVYDLLGVEITSLVNERKVVGEYIIEWNAKDLPSGMYIYQLQAGEFTETGKLVLQK